MMLLGAVSRIPNKTGFNSEEAASSCNTTCLKATAGGGGVLHCVALSCSERLRNALDLSHMIPRRPGSSKHRGLTLQRRRRQAG